MLNKKELQKIDWSKSAKQVHDFIRAFDSTPGAWTMINGEEARLFGSTLWNKETLPTSEVEVDVESRAGIIHESGLLIKANDGKFVNVEKIKIGTRTIPASKYGQDNQDTVIEFTEEELKSKEAMKRIWESILKVEVENDTDFFACGTSEDIYVQVCFETDNMTKNLIYDASLQEREVWTS